MFGSGWGWCEPGKKGGSSTLVICYETVHWVTFEEKRHRRKGEGGVPILDRGEWDIAEENLRLPAAFGCSDYS